jgi:uncharacterized lipoprotein YmbA
MKKMTLLMVFCAVLASCSDYEPSALSKSLGNNFAIDHTISLGGRYYTTEVYYDATIIWWRKTPVDQMTDSLHDAIDQEAQEFINQVKKYVE